MIAETIPGNYDGLGRKVLRPDFRRKGPHPTFPVARYFNRPLTVKCETIREIRKFLSTCRYVSDKEQFGKRDYWQPPEDFEVSRKGDCDDFALWTWRQLLAMGYDARFVVGRHGHSGIGHAWVTFVNEGKCYLVEPLSRFVGDTFPRLSTLFYHPRFSVAWDGEKVSYYAHKDLSYPLALWRIPALLIDWMVGWCLVWFVSLLRLLLLVCKFALRKLARHEHN